MARRWTLHSAPVAAVSALVGVLLTVVLMAPARWLAHGLAAATDGRLQLLNPRGTVWQGQAQLLLTGGPDSQDHAALPGSLAWRLRPTWLGEGHTPAPASLRGPALALSLDMPCCTPQGMQLWLQPGGQGLAVAVAPHQSEWPTPWLVGLGAPWNTLQLQARLQLATPGLALQLGPRGLQGQGGLTLDALDAASRLSTLRPMGSYRLHWQADTTALTLSTLSGALQLQGSGQWVAGRLRFEGHAQASPGREEALANLMNILGRRQGARTLIKIG
jgi:general secretion pathway protein N